MGDSIVFLNSLLLVLLVLFAVVPSNLLTYFLLCELVWCVVYTMLAYTGLIYDSPVIISLTMFCLVISGLEFALGLVLFFIY